VPIYEYQCTNCGEVFEAFQKITDEPLSQCKFCQSKVEKLFSQSTFHLKGSGWYLTDYARKNSTPAGEKPKTESSAEKAPETTTATASTGTSTTTESKP
jgi:putative FmdB family regulatory protein